MGLLSNLRIGDREPASRRHRRTFTSSFSTSVESLESRIVLSHAAAPVIAPLPGVNVGDIIATIAPDDIVVNDFQLDSSGTTGTISGLLGGLPFTAAITNFDLQPLADDPVTQQVECSILDLELGPIDIDLLGLHVDTSRICLSITAIEGGGLLGDLLCDIAGGGLDLDLLNGNSLLTDGLSQMLTGALAQAQPGGVPGAEDICDGECEILDLAIGPVDLTLLGLNVYLDNCEDGPVQVCVSASQGEGLLGDLLCGLTGEPVLGIDLDNLDLKDVTKLVNKTTNLLADGELSAKDLDKLTKEITKGLRK